LKLSYYTTMLLARPPSLQFYKDRGSRPAHLNCHTAFRYSRHRCDQVLQAMLRMNTISRCALYTIAKTQDKKTTTSTSHRTSPEDGKTAGPSNFCSATRRHASEPTATGRDDRQKNQRIRETLPSHHTFNGQIQESILATQVQRASTRSIFSGWARKQFFCSLECVEGNCG